MSEKEYVFIQRISIKQDNKIINEILPDHVVNCAIIENANMDGTFISMLLLDPVAEYRDAMHVKNGTEIEVVYGDPRGAGDNIYIDSFIVMPPVATKGGFSVEGFQKTIHELKKPAKQARYFANRTPAQIIQLLMPAISYNIDTFSTTGTYHLNAGAKPSRLIRQMARDYGAIAYYCRGTFYFKRIDGLLNQKTAFTFEHDNPRAEVVIAQYDMSDLTYMYERLYKRKYIQWDTVSGMMASNGNTEFGTIPISTSGKHALDNQNKGVIPILTTSQFGNTDFKPGILIKVIFNLGVIDRVIDEALPENQIIDTVSHYQTRNSYICKTILGIPHV